MIDSLWHWIFNQIKNPTFYLYLIFVVLVLLAIIILQKLHFEELLGSVNTWLTNEKNIKGARHFLVLLLILMLCFGGAFILLLSIMIIDMQKNNIDAIGDYFSIKYKNEITPKSEIEISQIVDEVNSIPNVSEKFERIAGWETKNFIDIYWHRPIMKSLIPYVNTYIYESNGKIRATHSFIDSPYAEDPYWIQFYKFGACGEEASLFANVTNRTGFATRFVVLDLGTWYYDIVPFQTGNHEFVEVQLADNKWYFFDPTVYGADHFLNDSPCRNDNPCQNRWFGTPDQYSYFSSDQVLGVHLRETNEDISERYSKISVHIMNSRRPLRIGTGNGTMSLPEINSNFIFEN
ncbi:MAG: transglutaminase-like domain-containing protein [Methanoregula sp.]